MKFMIWTMSASRAIKKLKKLRVKGYDKSKQVIVKETFDKDFYNFFKFAGL